MSVGSPENVPFHVRHTEHIYADNNKHTLEVEMKLTASKKKTL